jgi:hypothetical protein
MQRRADSFVLSYEVVSDVTKPDVAVAMDAPAVSPHYVLKTVYRYCHGTSESI